ncbi:MAG: protein translocase subunit SecF [Clostridia bacterium]|nr:protein translocase subunit SecF [Clostridia bacterium]
MSNFDFIAKRKLFCYISAAIMLLGIIVNLIFGVKLDIQFKGGTMLKYSYSGTLDKSAVTETVKELLPGAEVDISAEGNIPVVTVTLVDDLDLESQGKFDDSFKAAFPKNALNGININSLQATYGRTFFLKCLAAIALASLFLVIYVGIRFRRIGGISAGVMALLALLHDILIAYFTFVIFRIPLNDNFVAVVLTILGYSLNDTIVIYDRIRENRRKMDSKTSISEIVNVSLRQSFSRTLNTSICTFIAIGTVAVFALIFSMDNIVSFALPMAIGVISGFYTSTFLCTPIWAAWVEHSTKKKALKKSAKKK